MENAVKTGSTWGHNATSLSTTFQNGFQDYSRVLVSMQTLYLATVMLTIKARL